MESCFDIRRGNIEMQNNKWVLLAFDGRKAICKRGEMDNNLIEFVAKLGSGEAS